MINPYTNNPYILSALQPQEDDELFVAMVSGEGAV